MRRKTFLGELHPVGKCPDTDRLEEICADTLRLEGKMP